MATFAYNADMATRKVIKSLREARKAAELTQEQVAKALGISKWHLSRVENGRVRATWNLVVPMSRLYRQSADFLMSLARLKAA